MGNCIFTQESTSRTYKGHFVALRVLKFFRFVRDCEKTELKKVIFECVECMRKEKINFNEWKFKKLEKLSSEGKVSERDYIEIANT